MIDDDIQTLDKRFASHYDDYFLSLQANAKQHRSYGLQDHSFSGLPRPASSPQGDELLNKAILLEQFIATLFPIEKEIEEMRNQALYKKKLSDFKFKFVQKRCYRAYKKEEISEDFKDESLDIMPIGKFIDYVLELDDKTRAIKHIAYKIHFDPNHNIFKMPKRLDFENLIGEKFHKKDGGFESNYCIYCHNQEKDSCRTGMQDKTNPLCNKLSGCPLDQKISEMNYLYREGHPIAALAVTMIDNPLVAATGHRVCNDCMKSCIFQKQEPVDIPCIETDMVRDVLSLTYGAEIYYLLTRWNPLCNLLAKEKMPGHALVVGLGPAGFATAYYLLREGHRVTAIDGMDIKPLDKAYFEPIKDWKKLVGKYKPQGFGGVSEYGITDRWDKTNLLLVRMILERFNRFEIRGSTKFTLSQAQDFDHIALCIGAGAPIKPDMVNADAKGIYSAFTYLMKANMLTAPKDNGPVLILGAGLTAMDCAFEAAKYSKDVSIIYRKSMRDCPAYRENHDELQVSIDLGVKFIENTNLESIEVDNKGNVTSINRNIKATQIIYAFSTYDNDIAGISKYKDKISYLGDVNPTYAGTVVKAIASAKDMYNEISKKLSK